MNPNDDLIDRRRFFRSLSVTGLVTGAGMLTYESWQHHCLVGGGCRRCLAKKKCELPRAQAFRQEQQELKKRRLQPPGDIGHG